MKNYSKAAKRRAKQAMRLPGLAETPRREKSGRPQRETSDKEGVERDADSTVLKARARRMGQPASKASDMRRDRLSEQAGMALDILCSPDEAARLWGHFKALTNSEQRYHRSMGKSIHAKTAKIEMAAPDRFETRPDDQVDLRTQEERDSDAAKSWHRWEEMIGMLAKRHQNAIYTCMRGAVLVDERVKWKGIMFVLAMQKLDKLLR